MSKKRNSSSRSSRTSLKITSPLGTAKRLSTKALSLATAQPLQPSQLAQLSQSYTPATYDDNPDNPNNNAVNVKSSKDKNSNTAADHIKVIARFRPTNSKEKSEEKRQNLSSSLAIIPYNNFKSLEVPRKTKNKPTMNFTLDGIIWSSSSQEQCFNILAKNTVETAIEGYNCTIFAFGQTGSGKTYTMFGPDNYLRISELGIIPRSVDYMFKLLSSNNSIVKYQVSISIVEVYKEMLRDLLLTGLNKKNRKRLEILSAGKQVAVKNLTEKACNSVEDILKLIVLAQSNRAKHTTDFIGHDSSRSHCVVMISIMQRLLDDTIKESKLNFGDLAGSELASKTGAKSNSLKEAGKIHQGLLALENVINALVEKKKHVPYNDSKLTRLLSTSIGGNSKTTLLVTCSPSLWNRDETISTLRFAKRAKKIKNKAKINKRQTREQLEARIRYLENLNASLRKKLNKKKFGSKVISSKKNKSLMDLPIKDGQLDAVLLSGLSVEEKEKNEQLIRDKDDEINKLKELLNKKNDQYTQIEDDLNTKDEILNEFETEKKNYENTINILNKELKSNKNEIFQLNKQLNDVVSLQNKLNKHSDNLSSIVNDKINDNNTAMVSALSAITQQQAEFFNYFRNIQSNIDKIYKKQLATDIDVNNRFDDVNQQIIGISKYSRLSYGIGGGNRAYPRPPSPSGSYVTDNGDDLSMISNSEFDIIQPDNDNDNDNNSKHVSSNTFTFDDQDLRSRNLSVASVQITPGQILTLDTSDNNNNDNNNNNKQTSIRIHSPGGKNKHESTITMAGDTEVLSDLILSMRSYLSQSNKDQDNDQKLQDQDQQDQTNKDKKFFGSDFRINDEMAKNYKSSFSVGKKVDVLDVSYNWYSATIIDIDVFDKKAVYIKYDNFEDRWNEWIPLNKSYRISPHQSRIGIGISNPNLKGDRGGIHALIATRFGQSKNAVELQDCFLSDPLQSKYMLSIKTILIQGHLYKRSSWNKKNWKRRWFVIRNNHNIYYYDHKNMKSKQYRGVIALGNISIVQIAKKKGYTKYSFNIRTHKNKKHRFSVASEVDLIDWVSVLECLILGDCDQININKSGSSKKKKNNKSAAFQTMVNDPADLDKINDYDDDSDNSSDDNKKTVKRPITPRIRASISAIGDKWKSLTKSTSKPNR